MITLADMEGNETYTADMLGQAEEVIEERICDDDHLVIKVSPPLTSPLPHPLP